MLINAITHCADLMLLIAETAINLFIPLIKRIRLRLHFVLRIRLLWLKLQQTTKISINNNKLVMIKVLVRIWLGGKEVPYLYSLAISLSGNFFQCLNISIVNLNANAKENHKIKLMPRSFQLAGLVFL